MVDVAFNPLKVRMNKISGILNVAHHQFPKSTLSQIFVLNVSNSDTTITAVDKSHISS